MDNENETELDKQELEKALENNDRTPIKECGQNLHQQMIDGIVISDLKEDIKVDDIISSLNTIASEEDKLLNVTKEQVEIEKTSSNKVKAIVVMNSVEAWIALEDLRKEDVRVQPFGVGDLMFSRRLNINCHLVSADKELKKADRKEDKEPSESREDGSKESPETVVTPKENPGDIAAEDSDSDEDADVLVESEESKDKENHAQEKKGKKESIDAWAIKGYSKIGEEFNDWIKTRIEDIGRKKKNITKWKFDKVEDEKDDELWIEKHRLIMNEKLKIL